MKKTPTLIQLREILSRSRSEIRTELSKELGLVELDDQKLDRVLQIVFEKIPEKVFNLNVIDRSYNWLTNIKTIVQTETEKLVLDPVEESAKTEA